MFCDKDQAVRSELVGRTPWRMVVAASSSSFAAHDDSTVHSLLSQFDVAGHRFVFRTRVRREANEREGNATGESVRGPKRGGHARGGRIKPLREHRTRAACELYLP